MSVQNTYKNLRPFIRLDGNGTIIPGSVQFRPSMPKQGKWVELDFINKCCDTTPDSYIIFVGSAPLDADSTLISITYPGFSWTGTFAEGDIRVVSLPNGIARTITVTAEVLTADMAINALTLIGDGVILSSDTTLAANADPQTFTLTTTAAGGSQYLVQLTDD